MSAEELKIFHDAEAFHGRYLLGRLEHREKNPLYQACNQLVGSGHARWLPSWSNYFPGIVLTGKPAEVV